MENDFSINLTFCRFVIKLIIPQRVLAFWRAYLKELVFITIILDKLTALNWMMILMAWMVGTGRSESSVVIQKIRHMVTCVVSLKDIYRRFI